jgi:hypothetical protein
MEKSKDNGVEKGQEINVKFKKNRGKYPNSKEVLEKDLNQTGDDETKFDGQIVKSSDPESQEWHAREDSNKDKNLKEKKEGS